jgi:exosortase A-associated hydrolase 2
MLPRLVPTFIESSGALIFALLHRPAQAGDCVIVVPPFAEEMNKCRKMVTEVAGELVRQGKAVLLVDLFGTGDSEGDFEQGDWNRWKNDLRQAMAWANSQGHPVNGMLAIRLGCALGAEVAREDGMALRQTVFWQPVADGSRLLDQFLRLRVAAAMMEADRKESTTGLRQRLERGESIEVAGYMLSPTLAAQLDSVRLEKHLGAHLGRLHCIEVVRSPGTPAPVPVTKLVDAAAKKTEATLDTVCGAPFWSSVEILVNPPLIRQTTAFLSGQQHSVAGLAAATVG